MNHENYPLNMGIETPNCKSQTPLEEPNQAFQEMRGCSRKSNASSCSVLLFVILWINSFVAYSIESGSKDTDKITGLPGQPANVTLSQYSGYVTVDENAGRALFYWLIETQASLNPETRPLVMWMEGGPGVSSVGIGAWEELGPFRVAADGKTLVLSPYAWNQEANLLFVDSPAGVGFSYSNTSSDIISGDERTANDTFRFLEIWFERFPEYKNRPFYIGGESYAGHYAPELAKIIVQKNNGIRNPIINLQGFLVGNPLIDDFYDNIGAFEYWWNRGLISDATYKALNASCPFDSYLFPRQTCFLALENAYSQFGNINPFNIDDNLPTCDTNSTNTSPPFQFKDYDPCITQNTIAYMNIPEVQNAFHANVARIIQPWFIGSEAVRGAWTDSPSSMLPLFQELIAAGIRIWVYSGDQDLVLPIAAARKTLGALKLKILTDWYAWVDNNKVGGWSQVFEGLTYVTVRGGGHQVPLFRPHLAFTLFRHFLKNEPMPSS